MHLAHVEGQVEQLNGVVIEQGKLLERTNANVEKPPHYQ